MSDAPQKVRLPALASAKSEARKLAMLTAFDAITARWADHAGVDIVLVGDSLARSALGRSREILLTLEEMIHHCAAVARGARRAFRVGDMPFMSCRVSPEQALANAARVIQQGHAEAVKLEGGHEMALTVERLATAGIPVMAHIGLLPQSFHAQGGYRIQGRLEEDALRLISDAKTLEAAGAFSIVLEGIPSDLAGRITRELTIPTIGIGAGPLCDGQVLVISDLLGMSPEPTPKLARRQLDLYEQARQAIQTYVHQVRSGEFPTPENVYE